MSEPFLSEIRLMSFNFAPKGWAVCNGQFLPINQNQALFSLLGTTYGGDGKRTFALPDLQGSVPMHPGQGPGLSLHDLGETGGSDTVTLLESEIPAHAHRMQCLEGDADLGDPANNTWGNSTSAANPYSLASGSQVRPMSFQALALTGNSAPHNNLQPYLTLNFCIALQGIFPPRS